MISKSSKIYIAGHTGMVGSAIKRKLLSHKYSNIISRSHKDLDLLNKDDVSNFLNALVDSSTLKAGIPFGVFIPYFSKRTLPWYS